MVCITPITPLHCQNNCWRNTERGFPQIFIVGSYLPRGKMKYFNRSFSVILHKSNVKFDNTSCSWTSFLGFTSQHTTMGVYFTESRYGTEEKFCEQWINLGLHKMLPLCYLHAIYWLSLYYFHVFSRKATLGLALSICLFMMLV